MKILINFADDRWYVKEYDKKGNLIKITFDAGYINHRTYDESNNVIKNSYEGFYNHRSKLPKEYALSLMQEG